MILTIIVFILVIGILVTVHEFGHFIVAKLSGVKVEEFAFGFPPKLLSKRKGETLYILNLFPIGGYVKMLGEDENVNNPRSFSAQPTGKKVAVLVAGVVMNLVLAWVLLTIGFAVGMSPLISSPDSINGQKIKTSVIVAETKKDSPAEKAGLKQGDQIIDINYNGQKIVINQGSEITAFTTSHKGQTIIIDYSRDGEQKSSQATLSSDPTQPLGVAAIDDSIIRVAWYRAPGVALVETAKVFKLTFDFVGGLFKGIFTKGQVSGDVGGPIAIYMYTGMAVKLGVMAVLQFIAILSVNLALVNILPLPALDGGKVLFLILRRVMGKHFMQEKVENLIHTIGFALLIGLMILLTIKDIKRFF
jgi:regulator of sigma E protease